MRPDDLTRMSNQIAHFFAPYPEADAVAGVADHIRMFWDPSMRSELFAIYRAGAPPLHPLVMSAVDQLLAGQAP